ncbi:tRNA(Ser) Um(44) 2'-O-methyltransferase [Marasmius crinis-equi]|uniref:tRNA (uracil-O(2)-)-methyltransferase n=1 Tax=Marasmius crinis-equi TaxID=585013 RepID=A0ABR3G1F9_9AGAR
MAPSSSRPRFDPSPCQINEIKPPELKDGIDSSDWVPLISCAANFPLELFEIATSQLIHHPEYNSTLILRSETVSTITDTENFPETVPQLQGLQKIRCIHRKLLPRRPGRDAALEQYCTLYGNIVEHATDAEILPTTLVLTPIVTPDSPLPYYHPTVSHLAFRYLQEEEDEGTLRIEVVPLPNTSLDPNARLYRTCLALLDTLHRYGWGAMTNYQKRVRHDVLIPREEYQDLYLVMRERHKGLIDTWQEVTDPLKHVFEDIGIATYLMLLWKRTFATGDSEASESYENEPWRHWPRPPGGFIDFGCGNGLLTYILISEGYKGYGIDVRARTSWSSYPPDTQESLHVHAFDPTAPDLSSTYFPRGVFIIANHADELTPWTPVVSTLYSASGYLSIPCCAWTFDSRYERSSSLPFSLPGDETLDAFTHKLNLGGDGSNSSSYSMYRIWLATLSVHCGWQVECEILRIPSTRNWAIIGRKHSELVETDIALENVEDVLRGVQERGVFKPRKPEGKSGH